MENLKIYSAIDKLNNKIEVKTVNNYEDFSNTIIVFRGFPYYEILSEEEIKKEFSMYQDKGIALGAYVNDKIVGLNCIVYESENKHSLKFVDPKKVAYFSGLAVKEECRGLGIGKILVRECDKFLQDLKMFDYEYARILLHGSMSEGIFKLNNFIDASVKDELIVDEVGYIRSNTNKYATDERKYMVKKLNSNASNYFRSAR